MRRRTQGHPNFEWRRVEAGLSLEVDGAGAIWRGGGARGLGAGPGGPAGGEGGPDGGGATRGQGRWVPTFSPVSVTTSKGPYMKRPFSTWGRPSHTTVSLARWLEVTFWRGEMA